MNDSERQVAEALNALHLRWEYEPRLFVLTSKEDGNISEAFRPDFYLPDHDIYIEVTMMKQEYTTKKNHKVKLTRKLYPGTKIELIYRTHFPDLRARILEILQTAEDNSV
jgi:hypothetical protein